MICYRFSSLSLFITFILYHFLQWQSQVHQPSHRPLHSHRTSTSTRPSSSTPSLPPPMPTWALEQVHLVCFTLYGLVWFGWYNHQNSGRCNIFWLSGATSFGVDRAKQPRFSPYPHPVPPPSQVGQTELMRAIPRSQPVIVTEIPSSNVGFSNLEFLHSEATMTLTLTHQPPDIWLFPPFIPTNPSQQIENTFEQWFAWF